MSDVQINLGEIVVGKELPWPVYDGNGILLLKKGYIISSDRQLEILMQRGLYRQRTEEELTEKPKKAEVINPFNQVQDFGLRLKQAYTGLIEKQDPQAIESIKRVSNDLIKICKQDADAVIGATHLWNECEYNIYHPLDVALLCQLVTEKLGYDEEQGKSIIAAALTQNLGMHELQNELHARKEPLTTEQRKAIQEHPQRSHDILVAAGLDDQLWLEAILQHHERIDGSGYPNKLSDDDVNKAARLIGLADIYSAMVANRADRGSILAKDALREIFISRSKNLDEEICLLLIKELGIFPPGTFVRLANGEVAVVTRRGKKSMWPYVASIISPRGGPYPKPMNRDCSHEQFTIKEMCARERNIKLNLHALWGYA